jgi:hypothetical protein
VSTFGCRYIGEFGEGRSGESCCIGRSSDVGRANCGGGCSLLGERGGTTGEGSAMSVVMFGSGHCGDGDPESTSPLLPEGAACRDCWTRS